MQEPEQTGESDGLSPEDAETKALVVYFSATGNTKAVAETIIIPFCSHGGGRFGQSLTAIAKLAPDAQMGEGLSVHYSGGNSLPDDVAEWLESNGINGSGRQER